MNNKKWMSVVALCLVMLLNACGESFSHKVTVLDEEGKPIEGANVEFAYVGYDEDDYREDASLSDKNGVVKSNGNAILRIHLEVTKAGYYTTSCHKSKGTELSKGKNHDLNIVLRKKVKPIPLYARKVIVKLPVNDKKCGYDLKVADWLPPYGKGEIADLFFKGSKSIESADKWKTQIEITFPNKKDGIQKDMLLKPLSEFKSTRISPVKGYATSKKVIRQKNEESGYKGSTNIANYLLRVRSKVDGKGKLEQCHYVKLTEAFKLYVGVQQPDLPPAIGFTYYFNPTPNDRNLEFDPEKNLFKKLEHDEQVRQP